MPFQQHNFDKTQSSRNGSTSRRSLERVTAFEDDGDYQLQAVDANNVNQGQHNDLSRHRSLDDVSSIKDLIYIKHYFCISYLFMLRLIHFFFL